MPDRNVLPFIDLKNFKGLYTKPIPTTLSGEQLRVCSNVDFFRKYGGIAKAKGTSRILASQYQEGGVTKPISWVGFYKFPDLDGQILRRILIAAGTTIQSVDSSTGALTNLISGRKSGNFHMDDQLDRFMFITNQNNLLVGDGDDLLKYDGQEISNWGIKRPGEDETLIETFDDITDWTTVNSTIADELTTTFDGTSIKLTTSTGAALGAMINTLASTFSAPTGEADRVRFNVYISSTDFDNLVTSGGAIQAWFSSDTGTVSTNFYRFDFSIGNLVPGWNTLSCSFLAAPTGNNGTSGGTLNTSAIKTIQFGATTQVVGDSIDAYFDKLVTLSLGAPSGAFADTSGAVFSNDATDGIYTYRVTFLTKYGLESNAGDALIMDNRSGSDTYAEIDLTSIPISADSQVIARRVYRTIANGGTFLRLTQINDNTTTVYTDTTPDGSLGTDTPPILGSTATGKDTAVPPQAGIIKVWKKTVFMAGDPLNPATLYFSEDSNPEAFPFINTFTFEERITGLFRANFGLVVCTETAFWRVTGDNPNFNVERVLDRIGCTARRGAGTARRMGWAVDFDGMRLFDLVTPTKISEPIRDLYDALPRQEQETLHTTHSRKDNAIIQWNPTASGAFTSGFCMQYAVDDPTIGAWQTLDPPAGFDFMHLAEVEDTNGDPHLYAADRDGMLFEFFSDSSQNWTKPDGSETALTTTFTTPALRLGEIGRQINGWAGRVHPRWIELQCDGDATTWEVTVNMFKGPDSDTPNDSQTIEFSMGPDRSLIRHPTKLHPNEYMSFTLTNTDLDVTSTVLNLRVYFFTKPGQFQIDQGEGAGGNV